MTSNESHCVRFQLCGYIQNVAVSTQVAMLALSSLAKKQRTMVHTESAASRSLTLTALLLVAGHALALDNGVARTPPMGECASRPAQPAARLSASRPLAHLLSTLCCLAKSSAMVWAGWNSWNHFHCSVTADVLKTTADAFVELGLTALGYEFINTDDCWSQPNFDSESGLSGRGTDGRIIPAPTFANSSAQMKEMAAYIKSKGMRFGIYGAAGQTTCASRVGGLYHEHVDAQTYADWGAEYLKCLLRPAQC
eukprot:COSAG06_NODE_9307_length_1932_cov_1.175123_3_plen_252_part_00